MSNAKKLLEDTPNNTYGIEIEFGTHDNQMLSFTHIEVCYLHIPTVDKKEGWKIETDSDYTLELVSPILHFDTESIARAFEKELMRFLEAKVRNGILLESLIIDLEEFLIEHFTFPQNIWNYKNNSVAVSSTSSVGSSSSAVSPKLKITWIKHKEMQEALTWKNWDEDTDLERVLAARRVLEEMERNKAELNAGDKYIEAQMKQVLVTKSRKHGGLPSSQLNIPQTLEQFITYQTVYKRENAWKRLLQEENFTEQYIHKKEEELTKDYPELSSNKIWKAKYLNSDYLESKIDEKTPFWHRYWLWLETFYICAAYITQNKPFGKREKYADKITKIIDEANYCSTIDAKKRIKLLHLDNTLTYSNVDFRADPTAQLIYLIIYKVVAGTFSEMSETRQMQAQEKIMNLKGDINMEQIMTSILDNQFMQFHYALKDLTALWFKAPLMDVIIEENRSGKQKAVEDAIIKIATLEEPLEDIIKNVLYANLKLLGWYHSVCAANNQGFDYDWEEFCTYNMPSIPQFAEQLKHTSNQLRAYLRNHDQNCIASCTQIDQDEIVFLKRIYDSRYIAPWEGRWDTMKRVIKPSIGKPSPMYLVEHRNN
jgi:hypothetical protein